VCSIKGCGPAQVQFNAFLTTALYEPCRVIQNVCDDRRRVKLHDEAWSKSVLRALRDEPCRMIPLCDLPAE